MPPIPKPKPTGALRAARPSAPIQRQLSPLGLYSHAAEAAKHLPMAEGPPDQIKGTLLNKYGVKPDEIRWSGFDEAFKGRSSVTTREVSEFFDKNLLPLKEKMYGGVTHQLEDIENKMDEALRQAARPETDADTAQQIHDYFEKLRDKRDFLRKNGTPETMFGRNNWPDWSLPGAEDSYTEKVLHLPKGFGTKGLAESEAKLASLRREYADAKEKWTRDKEFHGSNSPEVAESLAKFRVVHDEYNKVLDATRAIRESGAPDFTEDHFHVPNNVGHLRYAIRIDPTTGEKVFQVEEGQSDWGEKGRKAGFATPAKKAEAKRLQREYAMTHAPAMNEVLEKNGLFNYKTLPRAMDALREDGPDVAFPSASKEDKEVLWAGYDAFNAANEALKKNNRAHPEGPYVTNTQKWTDLLTKNALYEAAKQGATRVVYTPPAIHAKRAGLGGTFSDVMVMEDAPGSYSISGRNNGSNDFRQHTGGVSLDKLGDYVGVSLADKIRADRAGHEGPNLWQKTYSGDDLNIGVEPMRRYYDDIFGKSLERHAQAHDPNIKLAPMEIPNTGTGYDIPPYGASGEDVLNWRGVPEHEHDATWRGYTQEQRDAEMDAYRKSFASGQNVKTQGIELSPSTIESILGGGFKAYRRGGAVGLRGGGLPDEDAEPFSFDLENSYAGKLPRGALRGAAPPKPRAPHMAPPPPAPIMQFPNGTPGIVTPPPAEPEPTQMTMGLNGPGTDDIKAGILRRLPNTPRVSRVTSAIDKIARFYGVNNARRLQRAADEGVDLSIYDDRALERAASPNNLLSIIHPKEFQDFAARLPEETLKQKPYVTSREKNNNYDLHDVLAHYENIARNPNYNGWSEVPNLYIGLTAGPTVLGPQYGNVIQKEHPIVRSHEGRHRSMTLAEHPDDPNNPDAMRSLAVLEPRKMDFAYMTPEDLVQDLRKRLDMTQGAVIPENQSYSPLEGRNLTPSTLPRFKKWWNDGGQVEMSTGGQYDKPQGALSSRDDSEDYDVAGPIVPKPKGALRPRLNHPHAGIGDNGGPPLTNWRSPLADAAKEAGMSLDEATALIRKSPQMDDHKSAAMSFITPRIPYGDVTSKYDELFPLTPEKIIRPEDLKDSRIIAAVGDRSATDRMLLGINDQEFNSPVRLHGGPDYVRGSAGKTGSAWASDAAPITGYLKLANQALEDGKLPVLAPMSMGRKALDSSKEMTKTVLQMLNTAPIKRADKTAFNEVMRAQFPTWPGIDSPRLEEWQNGLKTSKRSKFIQAMDSAEFRDRGFPDIASARLALTGESSLLNPMFSSGRVLAEMDPSIGSISSPDLIHPNYSRQAAGHYIGGFGRHVPADVMFADDYADRVASSKPGRHTRSILMSPLTTDMDQEAIDRISKYIEDANSRGVPKAKGGYMGASDENSEYEANSAQDGRAMLEFAAQQRRARAEQAHLPAWDAADKAAFVNDPVQWSERQEPGYQMDRSRNFLKGALSSSVGTLGAGLGIPREAVDQGIEHLMPSQFESSADAFGYGQQVGDPMNFVGMAPKLLFRALRAAGRLGTTTPSVHMVPEDVPEEHVREMRRSSYPGRQGDRPYHSFFAAGGQADDSPPNFSFNTPEPGSNVDDFAMQEHPSGMMRMPHMGFDVVPGATDAFGDRPYDASEDEARRRREQPMRPIMQKLQMPSSGGGGGGGGGMGDLGSLVKLGMQLAPMFLAEGGMVNSPQDGTTKWGGEPGVSMFQEGGSGDDGRLTHTPESRRDLRMMRRHDALLRRHELDREHDEDPAGFHLNTLKAAGRGVVSNFEPFGIPGDLVGKYNPKHGLPTTKGLERLFDQMFPMPEDASVSLKNVRSAGAVIPAATGYNAIETPLAGALRLFGKFGRYGHALQGAGLAGMEAYDAVGPLKDSLLEFLENQRRAAEAAHPAEKIPESAMMPEHTAPPGGEGEAYADGGQVSDYDLYHPIWQQNFAQGGTPDVPWDMRSAPVETPHLRYLDEMFEDREASDAANRAALQMDAHDATNPVRHLYAPYRFGTPYHGSVTKFAKGGSAGHDIAGTLGGLAGTILGSFFGGPIGGMIGSKAGRFIGNAGDDLIEGNSDQIDDDAMSAASPNFGDAMAFMSRGGALRRYA